jgi:hypothetical protein
VNDQDDKHSNGLLPQATAFIAHMDVGEIVSTEKHVTTVIVDNGETEKVSFTTPVLHSKIPVEFESIKDFLAKPLLIQTIVWDDTMAIGFNLMNRSVITTLKANAYWLNKITGFGLIRGTANLRVMLNATPFCQGELLIRFVPNYADHVEANFAKLHGPNIPLAHATQQPHVYLNCRDSSAEMSVPYIAPTDFCDIASARYDWGNFMIDVLSPLEVGTALLNVADVSVYLWFTDIELAAPMVAQSKGSGLTTRVEPRRLELEKITHGGTISSALAATSQIAASFATIPSLTAVAAPASWIANALSGLASAFGYSKPIHSADLHQVIRQQDRYGACSDGVDASYPLSILSNNSLSISSDLSIRNEDEMSFNFLKQVEAYRETVAWTTASAVDASLYSKALAPGNTNMYSNFSEPAIGGHITTYRYGPPIWYFSNIFAYWHGSISVRIKIIKTQFHTGRLQITWTPTISVVNVPDITTGLIALREIVDIATSDEITLTLPWYIAQNYLPVADPSGSLDIKVINQLRAPEATSQTVRLLIFFKGGPDFEFALPQATTIHTPWQAQSKGLTSGCVGDAGECSFATYPSMSSMGELFTSTRQLLSRFQQIQFLDTTTFVAGNFCVWPWFAGGGSQTAGTGVLNAPNLGGDLYSFLAPLYAFYRGSMRLRYERGDGTGVNNCLKVSLVPSLFTPTTIPLGAGSTVYGRVGTLAWNTATISGTNISYVGTEPNVGPLSFSIPYMSKFKMAMSCLRTTNANDIIGVDQPLIGANVYGNVGGVGPSLSRAIGEDFQFLYFINTPPLFVSTT